MSASSYKGNCLFLYCKRHYKGANLGPFQGPSASSSVKNFWYRLCSVVTVQISNCRVETLCSSLFGTSLMRSQCIRDIVPVTNPVKRLASYSLYTLNIQKKQMKLSTGSKTVQSKTTKNTSSLRWSAKKGDITNKNEATRANIIVCSKISR